MKLRLVKWLLKRMSIEEAGEATTIILQELGALPYKDIIAYEDNQLFINGRPLDIEKARQLRESANAALDNVALNLVREQVAYVAITQGVHKAETLQQVFWGRVGIWWFQQEQNYLESLAQRKEISLTEE